MRKVFGSVTNVGPAVTALNGLYPNGLLMGREAAVLSFTEPDVPSTQIDRFSAAYPITALRLVSLLASVT